ncbi:MAG: superoxide dismutase [Helicobacteraceae bacterium CG2_30_36_10]|nr:MAG: superoxide dismutase [Helicobacteraceae bacterium CG2_30_36_10]
MKFELMSLPYEENALVPYISAETVSYHYAKHHAGYVKKLNTLIEGSEFFGKSLEFIIKNSKDGIFNNAAQVFNHDFYWHGLSAESTAPSAKLSSMIERDFGCMEEFKKLFLDKATALFGSGWVWLVLNQDKKLSIEALANADNPLKYEKIALLTCDVWEHAYYIDYRNARADYLQNYWKLINWKFVSDNLAEAEVNTTNA